MSSDVTSVQRGVLKPSGDRLAAMESKLARLEGDTSKPAENRYSKERRKNVPYMNGKEVCYVFNSRDGCKKQTVNGGCKVGKKEFSHACNIWVKNKSAYCLLPHSRKDHK